MLRLLLAAAIVALVAVTGLAMLRLLGDGPQPDRQVVLVAGVALAISLAAAAFAFHAAQRARMLDAELRRLAAAVDGALRQRTPEARGREAAAPQPEIALPDPLPVEAAASLQPLHATTDADNVVHLPSAKVRHGAAGSASAESLQDALLAQTAAGDVELSLQPIVSIANGEARGFDVFRWIDRENGAPLDIRRIAEPPAGFPIAAFERQTIEAALAAGRRRIGTASLTTPLHVAISETFLASTADVDGVAAMLRQYPVMGGSVVLSIDARLLGRPLSQPAALKKLADAGFGFTLEAGTEPIRPLLADAAIRFVRIPVTRLISRGRLRTGRLAGLPLLEDAVSAGIPVIAGDVANDEDAVLLLDLGVDLMTGERFSAPRRLRPEGGRRPDARPPA